MRSLVLLAGVTALALAACDSERSVRISSRGSGGGESTSPALRVVDTLQCPQTEGVLTRTATGADGLSCTYSGPRGAEVVLRLIALDGRDVDTVLGEIERELQAVLPRAAGETADQAPPPAPSAPPTPAAPSANGDTTENVQVRMPGLSIRSEGDSTTIRLPGISIDSDGAASNVRVGGLTIDANDASGDVDIRSDDESVRVRASNEAAEIRTRSSGDGLRTTYILVDEDPAQTGWRLVGYEARGPAGGPLVVAIVRSKDRREDAVFDGAKALVSLNAGG